MSDVLLESLAQILPEGVLRRTRGLQESLHDQQGWNRHEDLCVTALNLLLELRDLLLSLLQKSAELVQLLDSLW